EKALRRGPMARFASVPLEEIRTADIVEMQRQIAGDRVPDTRNRLPGGPAAANMAVLVTRMVIGHAARTGLWDGVNVARDVRKMTVPNERNPVSVAASRRLAAACWDTLLGKERLLSREVRTGKVLAA